MTTKEEFLKSLKSCQSHDAIRELVKSLDRKLLAELKDEVKKKRISLLIEKIEAARDASEFKTAVEEAKKEGLVSELAKTIRSKKDKLDEEECTRYRKEITKATIGLVLRRPDPERLEKIAERIEASGLPDNKKIELRALIESKERTGFEKKIQGTHKVGPIIESMNNSKILQATTRYLLIDAAVSKRKEWYLYRIGRESNRDRIIRIVDEANRDPVLTDNVKKILHKAAEDRYSGRLIEKVFN